MKHKHAELIHAWADGAEIEFKAGRGWCPELYPAWIEGFQYRVKPEPKQDTFEHRHVQQGYVAFSNPHEKANVKLTYDGETGNLKSVEMIK